MPKNSTVDAFFKFFTCTARVMLGFLNSLTRKNNIFVFPLLRFLLAQLLL